jgi:hypothetical protein
MIHSSKLLKFTGAEVNTLQMTLDRYNENLKVLDSIEDYDTWKVVEPILEEQFYSLEKLMDDTYLKSVKRKQ